MSAQVLLHPAVVDCAQVSAVQLETGRRVIRSGHSRELVHCRSLAKHGDALAKWQAAQDLADKVFAADRELMA